LFRATHSLAAVQGGTIHGRQNHKVAGVQSESDLNFRQVQGANFDGDSLQMTVVKPIDIVPGVVDSKSFARDEQDIFHVVQNHGDGHVGVRQQSFVCVIDRDKRLTDI